MGRLHVEHGLDRRGRDMRTYGRRPGTETRERVPAEDGEVAELDSADAVMPGAFFTDAELDAILKEGLAEFERTRMTDEELNALLDEITADQSAREDRVLRALGELRQTVDRLRRDLRVWQPTHEPGLRHAVEHGFAGVKLDLGVAFHQFARLLRGEGLTVVDEAFGPVDPALRQPAPTKRRV